MEDFKKLLDLAFLSEDTVCVSNSKYAYHSVSIPSLLSGKVELISNNSKIPGSVIKTEELNLLSINPISGFRNDSNVYRLQSFLWEIDTGDINSQKTYVKSIGLPYSASVFSGNKSVHFLTVLEEPIDIKNYRLFAEWGLKIGTFFDKNCKNPSRCIRIPGVIRHDTGKKQELLEVKNKIELNNFLSWLNNYEHLRPKEREKRKYLTNEDNYENLSPWVKKILKSQTIDFGTKGRNQTWFGIFCDFAIAGYQEEQAVAYMNHLFKEEYDFREKEWLVTAQSAFKKYGKY